jgi:DNA polymerase-3 subunit gamma/tau
MAYQSLYRRYRPQRFGELRGQEHLVRALQHAVVTETVGHAYLFSGPRGTGKTSTARILAKVLNCENPIDGEPCGVCASCVAIEQGTSFDVFELDAASNNGVEAIRELIAKASLGTPGRTKVYILDEVHMLSTPASNALLKTLEEPPAHVVFVLATTDPQKVLPTIRSRTQHYQVHLLSADELAALATYIIEDAGLEVPPGAVDYVVRVGAGSARDMESALDQVVAAGSLPDDSDALDELVEALCERDTGRALVAVEAAVAGGRAPRLLGELLIGRLRDVFLAAMKADLARLPDRDRERVADQAVCLGAGGATRALEVLGEAFVGIQDAPDQRIPLEVALVRLTRPDADTSLSALSDRITRLEQGAPVVAAPAPTVPSGPTADSLPDLAQPTSAPEHDPDPALVVADVAVATRTPAATTARDGASPASSAREALQATKQARAGSPKAASAGRPPAPTGVTPQPSFSPPPVAPRSTARTPVPAAEPVADQPDAPDRSDAPPAAPAATPTAPAVPSGAADSPGAADGLPTREQLTAAWSDSILATLAPRAKAFFTAGRFLEVTDRVAVFGLPNEMHMQKCENGRADVEKALAAHFGRPVPLRLAVDGEPPAPTAPAGSTSTPRPPMADESEIDLADLTDADVATSSVDRVRRLFPGAELVDPT